MSPLALRPPRMLSSLALWRLCAALTIEGLLRFINAVCPRLRSLHVGLCFDHMAVAAAAPHGPSDASGLPWFTLEPTTFAQFEPIRVGVSLRLALFADNCHTFSQCAQRE